MIQHTLLLQSYIGQVGIENILIYADDYIGKPKALSGESHGTDNRIEFELDGKKHTIQIQVRKSAELQLISDIALIIEERTRVLG